MGKSILQKRTMVDFGVQHCRTAQNSFLATFEGFMKGFYILYAAMWRILSNLDVAFRVSIVWLLGMIGGVALAVVLFVNLPIFFRFGLFIAIVAILLFGCSVIAISWHRFCLLNQRSTGFFSLPSRDVLKSYLKSAIKVILVALLVFIPALILVFFIALVIGIAGNNVVAILFEAVINIVAGAIVAGISMFLPAAALEQRVRGEQIKELIFEQFGVLLSLSFAYYLLSLAISFALGNFGAARFPIGFGMEMIAYLAAVLFTSWFLFMLSIGYISELYGIFFIDEADDKRESLAPQPGQ